MGWEFIGKEFANIVEKLYGIQCRTNALIDPGANSIVERVHQTLRNLVRALEVHDNAHQDPQGPWSRELAVMAYAIRFTYHTTLQATPGQLAFGETWC